MRRASARAGDAGRSGPGRGPLGERTQREERGNRSIRSTGRSTGCRFVRPGPPRGPSTTDPAPAGHVRSRGGPTGL